MKVSEFIFAMVGSFFDYKVNVAFVISSYSMEYMCALEKPDLTG
jgi:hypothetical protein